MAVLLDVALTLHRVLHVLGKEVPHHLGADLPHIQLLGEPGVGRIPRRIGEVNSNLCPSHAAWKPTPTFAHHTIYQGQPQPLSITHSLEIQPQPPPHTSVFPLVAWLLHPTSKLNPIGAA